MTTTTNTQMSRTFLEAAEGYAPNEFRDGLSGRVPSRVAYLSDAIRAAQDELDQAVEDARAFFTWREIGHALGKSPQAAQQRYGR